MRGGAARSCFLAFLVSVTVAALDQSNSLDLKHNGIASSGESSLSTDADTQYNPLTTAPDLDSNKLSNSGANQYGASYQSYKTHDFQGRPLGINLHNHLDTANQVSEEDEALRSAAFASAKGNSGGGGSSAFSTVQGQGDSSARALSGGSGYSSALAQADTSGGYGSSQADAFAKTLSGGPILYGQSYPGAGYPGEGYGSGQQAQADASAQALSGGSSPYGTGYPVSGYPGSGYTGGGYGSAQAQADASAQALNGGPIPYGPSIPGAGYPGDGYGSASAQADATVQTLNGGSSTFGTGYPGSEYTGGGYGSAQAQAAASAQALNGGLIPYGPSLPGAGYPGDVYGSALAQADATAQTLNGGSSPFGTGYPGSGYTGGGYGSAQAQADASAQALNGGSIPYGSGYPGLGSPGGGYGSGRGQADASAHAQSGGSSPYGSGYPSSGYPGGEDGSSQAQADASAQVLNGGSSPYGSFYPGPAYGLTQPQSNALGSSSAQADASAQAISGGSSPFGSGYPVLSYPSSDYPSSGYNSAQAQADASAQTLSAGLSSPNSVYPSSGYSIPSYSSAEAQADSSSGYGNGQAQADALAKALSGGSVPYYPRAPGSATSSAQAHAEASSGYGSGLTQAEALAQTLNGGSSPYQPGLPSFNVPGSGYASAQAQADASAQALGETFSPSSSGNPNYLPSGGYSSAQAEADASSGYGSSQANADAIAQALAGGSSPFGLEYNSAQAQANAAAQAAGSSSAHASSSASAFSSLRSRVIPQQEIIYPDQIPGGNNVITCSREGELHNLWSASFDCMVCTCVRQYGLLVPLCASCSGCQGFNPTPQPQPQPFPPPPPPPPQPQPLPQVSCDPLPTNQYFQNPLNPCQTCICNPLVEFGVPDVRITCQEKPECILPPDAPVIPVIPDVPVPLPLCERFPQNVLFPHPSDYCRLCRCVTQKTLFGIPEQHIECMPNPKCDNGPPPLPPPFPPPYPQPSPPPLPPPQPQPQVSCDPLPTDQFFQNPLNPCQICVCRPLNVFGLPDVRITCQDNPQCVLPPDAPVIPPIPDIPVPLPLCERFPQNVIFPHPSDVCRLCKCVTRLTVIGIPEQHIECMPNPECDNGPPPTPLPFFPPHPPPLPPLPPPPQPQVSCAPLPTNQNFQNPLNPCQICICRPDLVYGVPEVKITCQPNPQCVIPPDAPVIPPIPNVPVPLPLCERFPQNVLFPHPSDYCRLCKCIVRVSLFGIPEQQIECGPNPECENRPPIPPPTPPPFFPPDIPFPPEPIYPPQPFPPSPEPSPFPPEIDPLPPAPYPQPPSPYPQPLPFVPIIRPEPVPWPPRPGPGPLPGPAPHESCLPYTPNIPFQHPWDECQLCMCSESHVVGLVSIEVDCYTKPSCCVEPPVSPLPLPGPLKPPVTPSPVAIQILDLICEFKTFAVQFLHPKDPCKKCSCEIFGRFVIPVCQRLNKIECSVLPAPIPNNQVVYIEPRCRNRVPYKQFVINCNLCVCQSAFNYVVAKCEPQPNCYPNGLRPTPYPIYGPEGGYVYSHASAEANAVAQNQPGYQYGVPGLPGTQYLIPGQLQPGGGAASAEAHAQAITTSYSSGSGQPGNQYLIPGQAGNQYFIPGQPSSNYVTPGQLQPGGGTSSASAEAQAISGNYPSGAGLPGNQYLIQPGSLNLIPGQPGNQYAIPGQLQPGGGYSSALAEAQASSGNYPSLLGQPGNQYLIPGQPGNQYEIPGQLQPGGGYSSALAEAQASSGNYPSLPRQPGSQYVTPGQLQPGGEYSSAEAQAQAISGNYPFIPGQFGNQYSIPGQPKNQYLIPGRPGNQYLTPGQLQPAGGYYSASAEAQAQAISGNYPSGPGQPGNQYSIPSQNVVPGNLQPGGGYSSASAEAQAVSGSYPSGPTYPYQGPGYEPAYGLPAANAQASANAVAEYNPNEQFNSGLNYLEPLSSSYANAEALASANEQQPYYIPGVYVTPTTPVIPSDFSQNHYPGRQTGAQATADAYASSDTGAAPALYPSPSNGNSYPYTPFDYPGSNQGGYSSAQAQAQASARAAEDGLATDSYNNNPNSQNNYLPSVSQGGNALYPKNYDLNYLQNGNAYPVFNEANAKAEAVAASDMYPSMYPRPSSQKTPLYVPGQNGWDSGATPQTTPLLHGDTSAQNLAQAQTQAQAGSA